eukprot:TRINITY_DN1319_c0_g1_i5.p1 TRINITY_DN1319_c0_g1~~TRINITY_DN1319_c0_g1_i5.p1  ORF type:complete len:850 (+),score=59.51 TRINITY_DN1319_c0_g1_i5:102-2552(+)
MRRNENEAPCYTQTAIMSSYSCLNPTPVIIYEREGSTSIKVYKITLEDSCVMILKILELDATKMNKYNSLLREYYIGKTLGQVSRNIVKFLDMKQINYPEKKTIRVELLMEYGGEDLCGICNYLTVTEILNIAQQLLEVLALLEERGIAHFDIKPENITWDNNVQTLKLIDFGTSLAFYREPQRIKLPLQEYSKRLTGFTKYYAPPELLKERDQKDVIPQKVDVFCFGITFLELLWMSHGIQIDVKRDNTLTSHKEFLKIVTENLVAIHQEQYLEFICKCIAYEPKERLSFSEAKTKFCEILTQTNTLIVGHNFIGDYEAAAKEHENLEEYEAVVWCYEKYLESHILENKEKATKIYSSLGAAYNHLGDWNSALITFEALIEIATSTHDKMLLVDAYCNTGTAYDRLGKFEDAIQHFTKAIKLLKSLCGKDTPLLLEAYHNLGSTYDNSGDFIMAIHYLKKCKANAIKYYGETHSILVKTYNNIGLAYKHLNRYDCAIQYYNKAEELASKTHTNDHPLLGIIRQNLVTAHSEIGNHKKAVDICVENIANLKKVYGEDHPELSATYNQLGLLYYYSGEYKKAIEQYLESERILKVVDGEESPKLVHTYTNIGLVHSDLGKFEVALKYYAKAEDLAIKPHAECGLSLATLYNHMGSVYCHLGKYQDAIGVCRKSETMIEQSESPNLALLVVAYNNLASAYSYLSNYNRAIEYFLKTIDISVKLHGECTVTLAGAYNNLGATYCKVGQYDKATDCLSKTEKIIRTLYGDNSQFSIKYSSKNKCASNQSSQAWIHLQQFRRTIHALRTVSKFYRLSQQGH